MNSGIFVTATGTDVGKTFVTALLVKKWRDEGIDAGYYKAALSGAEFRDGVYVAGDAEYVKTIAQLPDAEEELVSYVYKEAVSPHLAARKEGNPVELLKVRADYARARAKHEFVFVEGSGGIVCPIRYDKQKIFLEDIIKALGLDIVIVSTALLGSINAAVLTVEYARARGIGVRGVIFNRYGDSEMERDNRQMIAEIARVPILACVPENASKIDIDIKVFQ